jgi:hypothetical protein
VKSREVGFLSLFTCFHDPWRLVHIPGTVADSIFSRPTTIQRQQSLSIDIFVGIVLPRISAGLPLMFLLCFSSLSLVIMS